MLRRIVLMSLLVLALALPAAVAQGPADPGKGMAGCPLHSPEAPEKGCKMHAEGCCKMKGGEGCKMHGEGCCKMKGGEGCCRMHGEGCCKMQGGEGCCKMHGQGCSKDGCGMGPGAGPCPMMGHLGAFLQAGLSDKQVADLLQLQTDMAKKQYPLMRKQHDLDAQLDKVRDSEKPEVDKLKDLMVEMAKVRAELEGNKMTVHEKVMGILTPEQREKLEAQGMPLMGGHGKGCGKGPGPGPMGKAHCGMMEPKKAE